MFRCFLLALLGALITTVGMMLTHFSFEFGGLVTVGGVVIGILGGVGFMQKLIG